LAVSCKGKQPAHAMSAGIRLQFIIREGRACIATTTRCCLGLKAIHIQQCIQREAEYQDDNQQTQADAGLAEPFGMRQKEPMQIFHHSAE